MDTAQKAYDAFAKEIETLGKDGQRRRDDVERLKGEATEILQRVAALNGTVAEQDRLFQADRTSLANVKKLGPATPCPTCRVPLGTNFPDVVQRLEQVIRERGETLAGLRGQITQFDRRVKKINQDRVTIEQAVPPLGQLDAILRQKEIDLRGLYQKLAAAEQAAQGEEDRLIALAEQIDTLRAQIGNEPLRDDPVRLAAIEAELQTLQGLTGELKAALEQQLNLRSVDAIDADLTALRDARDQKLQRVKELWQPTDPFVDDAPAWQEWRQSLTQTRDDWAAHIRAGELEVARAEEQVKILGPHVADLDEKARAYELAARTHRRMGVIVAVLTTLRTNIMGGIRPALERYTSQLLAAVSNGTYQHVRIDEDYQVQVEGLYGFHPANQYSGGEHDLVNFCFRIAISRHLLDTVGHYQTCVVLDEMFGSQDPDRRFALRQYIKQLSRLEAGGHFQQIILISHIPDVLDDCDQLLSIDHDATTGMSRLSSEANALVREAVAMLPG